jgi:AAA15 family ATPase/GTPase
MKIVKIQIENYKSFFNPTKMIFSPGFNIIVGKNNSGKTALTEILSLDFEDHPHKSPTTLPNERTSIKNLRSKIILTIEINHKELQEIISNEGKDFFLVRRRHDVADLTEIKNFKESFNSDSIRFRFTFIENVIRDPYYLTVGEYQSENAYKVVIEGDGIFEFSQHGYQPKYDIAVLVANTIRQDIFSFRAERFKVGQHPMGESKVLAPDAVNLPEVLSNLKLGDSAKFRKIIDHMNLVFPDVVDIPIKTIKNVNPETGIKETIAKLFFSPFTPKTRREDLEVPLQDSGTGIGQVLAIFYVVVTSTYPKTIIIDEPQSFLHPGAIRTFISILRKNYFQHQYIITTHSPTVISSVNPTNIIQLTKKDFETTAINLLPNSTSSMKSILGDVGASLSDVFGAENILWVEGPTEVECFQEIIDKRCQSNLLGTALQAVIHTGDFETKEKKTAELIHKIYDQLSKSTALIPPAIGFLVGVTLFL